MCSIYYICCPSYLCLKVDDIASWKDLFGAKDDTQPPALIGSPRNENTESSEEADDVGKLTVNKRPAGAGAKLLNNDAKLLKNGRWSGQEVVDGEDSRGKRRKLDKMKATTENTYKISHA